MNKPIEKWKAESQKCLLNRECGCNPKHCTGWIEIYPEVIREDPLNKYNDIMIQLGQTRDNQSPINKDDKLILEEKGLCYKVIEVNHLVKKEYN